MSDDRRVFLEVKDPAAFLRDMQNAGGLFVPTRLSLPLGTLFMLGVRLPNVQRAIELPMIVIGRRIPRRGSLLSGGVVARLADASLPMFQLLEDYASGKVVDLEARIQEQVRIAARAHFASLAEATLELRALLETDAAPLPLDQLVQRGDRLALTVSSDDAGDIVVIHVLVRGTYSIDGQRGCTASPLDEAARARLRDVLDRLDNSNVRSLRA